QSLPYVNAGAAAEAQVNPVKVTNEKIMGRKIRGQVKKGERSADSEIEKVFPALQRVIVTITTTDGRSFTKQLDYPKGDPRNPLTDQEVEEKFAALAEGVLSPGAQKKLKDAIWNLEKIDSVSKLMGMMTADMETKKKGVTAKSAKKRRKGR